MKNYLSITVAAFVTFISVVEGSGLIIPPDNSKESVASLLSGSNRLLLESLTRLSDGVEQMARNDRINPQASNSRINDTDIARESHAFAMDNMSMASLELMMEPCSQGKHADAVPRVLLFPAYEASFFLRVTTDLVREYPFHNESEHVLINKATALLAEIDSRKIECDLATEEDMALVQKLRSLLTASLYGRTLLDSL